MWCVCLTLTEDLREFRESKQNNYEYGLIFTCFLVICVDSTTNNLLNGTM